MTRDLRFEIVYPHPPERVWRALTDPRALADWLIDNDSEPRAGHRFQFRTRPAPGFDGVVRCEVVEVEAPYRLAYTWLGGSMRRPTTVFISLRSLRPHPLAQVPGLRGSFVYESVGDTSRVAAWRVLTAVRCALPALEKSRIAASPPSNHPSSWRRAMLTCSTSSAQS